MFYGKLKKIIIKIALALFTSAYKSYENYILRNTSGYGCHVLKCLGNA